MEMLQLIHGYTQVHTGIEYVNIPTLPLEKIAGIERVQPLKGIKENDVNTQPRGPNDFSTDVIPAHYAQSKLLHLPRWRQHSSTDLLVLQDLLFLPISVDRITIFSVRPPELRHIFDIVGNYFRWFARSKASLLNAEEIAAVMNRSNLQKSTWVDGLGYIVWVCAAALPEILSYIESAERQQSTPSQHIISMLKKMAHYYSIAGITQPSGTAEMLSEIQSKEWYELQE